MKVPFFFLATFLAGFMACGDPHPGEKKSPEVPKALTNEQDGYEISSKRRKEDLVENLYDELAGKSPGLNALELNIRNLQTSQFDSSAAYDHFNNKNLAYYRDAKNHLEQISDSSLKEKIRIMLSASLERYHATTSKHDNLLQSIESKKLKLNDLHILLKIMKTLPVIETYQKDNLPETAPLKGFEKRLEVTIKSIDTLLKK